MLSLVIDRLVKTGALRDAIVKYSFFAFNGLLGGILINDLIRILYGDYDNKFQSQLGAAALIGASGYLYDGFKLFDDRNNNVALGAGFATGSYFADQTQHGRKILP